MLLRISDGYSDYLCSHRGPQQSYIIRILGAHCLKLYDTSFYFYVMENLFQFEKKDVLLQQRYDIKGSWVNRNMTPPRPGQVVTCRHCNQK